MCSIHAIILTHLTYLIHLTYLTHLTHLTHLKHLFLFFSRQVCGENTIDLDLLKHNTEYSGAFEAVPPSSSGGGETKTQNRATGSDGSHPVVKWLWEILESFGNEDRSRFVKFASGRTRLSDEKDFTCVLLLVVMEGCL